MKRVMLAGMAISGFVSFGALACESPSMVTVPDGSEATMDQMVTAQQQVRAYVAAMEEYLACVNDELETAGDDAPEEYKSLLITRHNTAVNEMEAVAAAFNEEVQAYKAANPD
jgi:outer membrane murein-binding lipoprotein Lpp